VKRVIFHKLVTPEEALEKLKKHIKMEPVGVEEVSLTEAYGRVLAENVKSPIDVPPFTRSTVDGYAVRSMDVTGARDDNPVKLKLVGKVEAGEEAKTALGPKECVEVSTGAPLPPNADAVVMVEYTRRIGDYVEVFRPLASGENIAQTGSDVMLGETIAYKGTVLTPQTIAAIAAAGISKVKVYRRPKVAIISTGNELKEPGEKLEYGKIYDVNTYSLYASVIEDCGEPEALGILPDNERIIENKISKAIKEYDIVLISGGTSAGLGDIVYRVLNKLGEPGIIVHGLNIKPGKPTVIAVINGKPVFGLPGFPVSCLIVYNLIVKPVIRAFAGLKQVKPKTVEAYMALRVFGAKGRRTHVPVALIKRRNKWVAYPVGGDSGSIVRLSRSDGYIVIPENTMYIDEGEKVTVHLFTEKKIGADLVSIGSHCPIAELIMEKLMEKYNVKIINVGSMGGFLAIKRGEADIAGIHLYDPETGTYNIPYLKKYNIENAILVRGYLREQGIIVAKGNPYNIKCFEDIIDKKVRFINRNKGSGTRLLIDQLLEEIAKKRKTTVEKLTEEIEGFWVEAKTHSAVASAIKHGKADVGVGLRYVAEKYGLDFIPLKTEEYDFLINKKSLGKEPVKEFISILKSQWLRKILKETTGYKALENIGKMRYGENN